jgi:hypothetical protein
MEIWVSDRISAARSSVSCAGVSFAEYKRNMVHDETVQRGASFRERGPALRSLSDRVGLQPLLDLFGLA